MKPFALFVLCCVPFFANGQAVTPDSVEPVRPQYMLAPRDQILIRAPQAKKLDGRIFQIQADGFVTLPSIGRVRAGGMIQDSFGEYIAGRLPKSRSGNPEVHVLLVNFKSKPPDK